MEKPMAKTQTGDPYMVMAEDLKNKWYKIEKKIANYTVMGDSRLSVLITNVKTYIEQGWEPIGGVCVTQDGAEINFYQALVKKE